MPVMPVSAVKGRRCEVVRAAHQGDVGFDSSSGQPQTIVRFDSGDQAVVLEADIQTARPPQDGETPGARMAREQTEAGIVEQPGREQQLPAGDPLVIEPKPPTDKDPVAPLGDRIGAMATGELTPVFDPITGERLKPTETDQKTG